MSIIIYKSQIKEKPYSCYNHWLEKLREKTYKMRGSIEKIIFVNENNNFTVAKFKPENSEELITIVGNMAGVSCGELLDLEGISETSNFGPQFKVEKYSFIVPTTKQAIEKYLGSGLIKGIGPELAKRLVKKFGEKTLDIIENKIELLKKVNGIGENRIKIIAEAWQEQKEIKNIMLFLQGHGISTNYSLRIFKQYGKNTIAILKENPYRLVQDIFGIGFKIADTIALKIGIPSDSPLRIEAGVLHILNECICEGHVYYPKKDLELKVIKIIGGNKEIVEEAMQNLLKKNILSLEQEKIYLSNFLSAEKNIANKIKVLLLEKGKEQIKEIENYLTKLEQKEKISLDPRQKEAVTKVFFNKITVITGGPGTGKTTLINFIVKILKIKKMKVVLAAPTGRAAKQLTKATGTEAKTIHRLLEFNPARENFFKNSLNPLEADVVIIDESSMLDLLLMNALIEAIPNYAHLILVGDVDQLPSVNAGNILYDIINSSAVECISLKKIFRQAKESLIVTNAHRMNQGLFPYILNPKKEDDLKDFYFIEKTAPAEILETIINLIKERIPQRFNFDPLEDIQVLSPMHKGETGVENLNIELQKVLNPSTNTFTKGSKIFKLNDKIMQLKNNYNKEIFNGDIGKIVCLDNTEQLIKVNFNDREIIYDRFELDELTLAYAISVHKSQGSEYKCVIIPLTTQHYMLLQRNMLYTAVTRGKQLVIIIGTKEAIGIAVRNNKIQKRYSNLKNFINST